MYVVTAVVHSYGNVVNLVILSNQSAITRSISSLQHKGWDSLWYSRSPPIERNNKQEFGVHNCCISHWNFNAWCVLQVLVFYLFVDVVADVSIRQAFYNLFSSWTWHKLMEEVKIFHDLDSMFIGTRWHSWFGFNKHISSDKPGAPWVKHLREIQVLQSSLGDAESKYCRYKCNKRTEMIWTSHACHLPPLQATLPWKRSKDSGIGDLYGVQLDQ